MATEEFCGPIDYLVFAFPASADPGSGLAEVVERVDRGDTEVLDIELIARDAGGGILPAADLRLDDDRVAGELEGAFSGILDIDDRDAILAELAPGEFAIAIVYEDRSFASAARAWSQVGGRELFSGGVDIADLETVLQEGAPA